VVSFKGKDTRLACPERDQTHFGTVFVTGDLRRASIEGGEMNKRNLQPNELDAIGKKLIAHDIMSESEIENIVSSPFLYSSVRNRILADAASTGARFGFARYFVFAGSSLAVVFSIFATIAFLRVGQKPVAVNEPQRIVNITSSTKPDGLSIVAKEPLPTDPLVERVNPKRRVAQQAQSIDYRRPDSRPSRTGQQQKKLPPIEFYPVTYAGDITDAAGGRVVRVELSRQALFSMGLNIPLENGIESVKADLLIGPDGVTRGVRLAKVQ
jgi:hypothetical protein